MCVHMYRPSCTYDTDMYRNTILHVSHTHVWTKCIYDTDAYSYNLAYMTCTYMTCIDVPSCTHDIDSFTYHLAHIIYANTYHRRV